MRLTVRAVDVKERAAVTVVASLSRLLHSVATNESRVARILALCTCNRKCLGYVGKHRHSCRNVVNSPHKILHASNVK